MPAFVLSLLALACVAVLMVAAPKPARSAFGAGSDCWQGGGSWVSVPSVSLRLSSLLSSTVWLLQTVLPTLL
jgi:hypothetical protein